MKKVFTLFFVFALVLGFVSCGKEGLDAIIRVTEELPGVNCEYGGQKVETGLGTEITDTFYVCNGKDGRESSTNCIVGTEGPSGGYVFFCDNPVNKLLPTGKIGLEVAPEDLIDTCEWSNIHGTFVDNTGLGIGTGVENTQLIMGQPSHTASAASKCFEYYPVDYPDTEGDWFLPSRQELNRMYVMFVDYGVGGFATNVYYWSSSEITDASAWVQTFLTGYQNTKVKDSINDVRCVRAF